MLSRQSSGVASCSCRRDGGRGKLHGNKNSCGCGMDRAACDGCSQESLSFFAPHRLNGPLAFTSNSCQVFVHHVSAADTVLLSYRRTTCAEASKKVKSVRGGAQGKAGNCEELKATCKQPRPKAWLGPDGMPVMIFGVPVFLPPSHKCVCISRYKLLPKGKAMNIEAGTDGFSTTRVVEDARPGDDCSKDQKRLAPSRNVFVDDTAGCKCVCFDPRVDVDPAWDGDRCMWEGALPFPTDDGKDGRDGRRESLWSWDAYPSLEDIEK